MMKKLLALLIIVSTKVKLNSLRRKNQRMKISKYNFWEIHNK